MDITGIFARIVATVGAAAILARRWSEAGHPPLYGPSPAIPEARPQSIPTLKMPTARG